MGACGDKSLSQLTAAMQAGVCVPVVLWLFLVEPISLRTMHDDEPEPHTGQGPSHPGIEQVADTTHH